MPVIRERPAVSATEPTFIDWNDRNAHAAAECAIRMMGEGVPADEAAQEVARQYSTEASAVTRWISRIAVRSLAS